ncbi:hypothetical protein DM860_005116 [Cuscuta australis]|uniref:Ribosomal protein L34Ae n=1 Tax=Cuscuta australis TaxID=267555 RepID=A0A328DMD7_9ASTE|nr:hypothetical protein DM860_005116 [Cuscuta australis]
MATVHRLFAFTVSSLLQPLFGFIASFLSRLGVGVLDSFEKSSVFSETSEVSVLEDETLRDSEPVPEVEMKEEKENSDGLVFRFPTYEEFIINCRKGVVVESGIADSESASEKGFMGFVAEELDLGCSKDEDTVLLDKGLKESPLEGEVVYRGIKLENSDNGVCGEEENEKEEICKPEQRSDHVLEGTEFGEGDERELGKSESQADFDIQSEKDSMVADSDSVSPSIEPMQSLMSRLVDLCSDEGFLSDSESVSDKDDGAKDQFKQGNVENTNLESQFLTESDFQEDEESDSPKKFKQCNRKNPDLESGFLSESDFQEDEGSNLESLWEHQDLLEQLKTELRKMRATGLPTIYEDSESLKMDELKRWKINERFQNKECITVELNKFNKIYKERMRKFDIVTYQKLYAISFLQKESVKDPFKLLSSHKSSAPPSLLKNIWPFKHKNSDIDDPVVKFIKELQCELEVVYVGQMCLSWEFLHWQYGKALDLWDTDLAGSKRYNEVAEEFQHFQVLLQRYIEDERFQGPRVQCYIKSRCDFRDLLQVPVIREDSLKHMKKGGKFEKGDCAITSDILVEILEECIRIFWRFVKSDNDSTAQCHSEIEDAEDHELLMEVRRSLQKKEKKLRDGLRSESSILRRFKQCRDDDDSDHVLYFFSQVNKDSDRAFIFALPMLKNIVILTTHLRSIMVWFFPFY